jgi:pimeloyl-ACP methyl ester carboxylesterase
MVADASKGSASSEFRVPSSEFRVPRSQLVDMQPKPQPRTPHLFCVNSKGRPFERGSKAYASAIVFKTDEGVLQLQGGRTVGWMLRGPEEGRTIGWFHGQPGSRRDIMAFSQETLSRFGVRMFAIDRGGYGDTSPVGLDRRDVARDLLAVADFLGVGAFPVMAVSMGAVYALTLAALAADRVEKVVLISGHVLPYDDPAIVAALSRSEQDDLSRLREGRTAALDAAYAVQASDISQDAPALLRTLSAGWDQREQALVRSAWGEAVASSVAFGVSTGHIGLLEDGLRTIMPLEIELSAITCPVRALHGVADDLEPLANLEKAARQLADCVIVTLPGMGHFGPWLWPDSILGLLTGE